MSDYDPFDAPNDPLPANPYHADAEDEDALAFVPFAGRGAAMGRWYQHLTDPARSGALAFIGRRRIGKTALLRAFDSAFGATFTGAYVGLRTSAPDSETGFVLSLAQSATAALVDVGAGLSRLHDLEPPGDDPRAWFTGEFLPNAIASLRQGKRLVFLLDDTDRLLNAVRAGRLREDVFAYLRNVMVEFPTVGMALTINADAEDELTAFSPLVDPNNSVRLTNLELADVRWLVQEPARAQYVVPDDCAETIYKATGGIPMLAQHFGFQLFQRWLTATDVNVITQNDIRSLTPTVYKYAEPEFRQAWSRLNAGERAVLSAISGCLYDDPLTKPDASALESWLIETDYPLDATAIGSVLRGLEYRELIGHADGGVQPSAGMWATWLLENAQLDSRAPRPMTLPPPPPRTVPLDGDGGLQPRPPLRAMIIIGAVLGVILAVIVLAAMNASGTLGGAIPQPTVTLGGLGP